MINTFKAFFREVDKFPYASFWKAAIVGLFILTSVIAGISGYHFRTGIHPVIMSLGWIVAAGASFWTAAILLKLLSELASKVPRNFILILLVAIISLLVLKWLRFRLPDVVFYYGGLFYLLANSALIGLLWQLKSKGLTYFKMHFYLILIALSIVIVDVFGIYWFASEGSSDQQQPVEVSKNADPIPDPSQPGKYEYDYFFYGNGTDIRRSEYSDQIRYKSPLVDASLILPEWKGKKAKWRKRYWGFGVKELPLNGRVWFPQGDEAFPIILIVHGNHGMEHHSDPGYAYLGELLASRGYITVSVDENFINGTWSGDFRGKEMPARAWLLLKHLELWREWSNDPNHELFGKVDMDRIILAGHSRGGEAVPIAAAYNKLKFFPDNANEKFDFNFNIKGLIAIAPTDKRYDRRIKLENINYLTLQGSYDSDEASFFGLRQLQRITFTDSNYWFKTGVYIHGANHGQFNTIWGRKDSGAPWNWLLNLKPIIKAEDQQQIAKQYISAFAEIVFNQKTEYTTLFKNAKAGQQWLPPVPIISNFEDSNYSPLLSFEEDLDLTSWIGGKIEAKNLETWKEEELKFRDKDTQAINAVILGWDYHDEMEPDSIASYEITIDSLKPQGANSWKSISLNLASGKLENENEDDSPAMAADFTLILEDTLGNVSKTRLSQIAALSPPLDIQFLKLKGINKDVYGDTWEPTLETIEIDFDDLNNTQSPIEIGALKKIRFVFDATNEGVLIINEIGFQSN